MKVAGLLGPNNVRKQSVLPAVSIVYVPEVVTVNVYVSLSLAVAIVPCAAGPFTCMV
jgi:hypothetical protein